MFLCNMIYEQISPNHNTQRRGTGDAMALSACIAHLLRLMAS